MIRDGYRNSIKLKIILHVFFLQEDSSGDIEGVDSSTCRKFSLLFFVDFPAFFHIYTYTCRWAIAPKSDRFPLRAIPDAL